MQARGAISKRAVLRAPPPPSPAARVGTPRHVPCPPVVQRLEEVALPFCVFHSENDTMVDVDGSKALYTRAKVRWRGRRWGGVCVCLCDCVQGSE